MGLTLSEQLQQTGGQEPTITKAFSKSRITGLGEGGMFSFFIYTECSGLQVVAWKGVA